MKKEFYLNIDDSQIKVYTEINNADMPYIVFLHDSLGCITLWRDFPLTLGHKTGYNILMYDRVGYGESDPFKIKKRTKDYLEIEADFLIKLLDKLQINKSVLFGYSDGGTIALLAASKYNNRFLGIITEGAHIFVEEITLNGIKDFIQLYKTTNIKTRLAKYHGDKTESIFKMWTETWLDDEYRDWNIESFLPHITCPTYVIQGEGDEYGSYQQVNGIKQGIKQAETEVYILPNANHTPHKEAKEETIQLTLNILKNINVKA